MSMSCHGVIGALFDKIGNCMIKMHGLPYFSCSVHDSSSVCLTWSPTMNPIKSLGIILRCLYLIPQIPRRSCVFERKAV